MQKYGLTPWTMDNSPAEATSYQRWGETPSNPEVPTPPPPSHRRLEFCIQAAFNPTSRAEGAGRAEPKGRRPVMLKPGLQGRGRARFSVGQVLEIDQWF